MKFLIILSDNITGAGTVATTVAISVAFTFAFSVAFTFAFSVAFSVIITSGTGIDTTIARIFIVGIINSPILTFI